MRIRNAVLSATVAVLALAGCGGAQDPAASGGAATQSGSTAPATATSAAATSAAATGSAAAQVPDTLRFTARTLDGATFDGAKLAGRPAVLWFWAPWCPTCRGQASGVAATAARFADRVAVVGVAGLDDEAAMRRFVDEQKVSAVPHLSDERGAVWQRFSVTEQSTFVLLDRSGQVAFKGNLGGDELAERVAGLA